MKTKAEAEKLGRDMIARLGKGWKMVVHENLGWWVSAQSGPLSVSAYGDGTGNVTYSPSLSCDYQRGCTDSFWHDGRNRKIYTDPVEAVRDQVAFAREFVNMVTETINDAEKVVANFVCPSCHRKL